MCVLRQWTLMNARFSNGGSIFTIPPHISHNLGIWRWQTCTNTFFIMLQGLSNGCSISLSAKGLLGTRKQKYDGTSLKGFIAKTDGDVCLQLINRCLLDGIRSEQQDHNIYDAHSLWHTSINSICNTFCFCNLTYFRVKQDIQQE